MKKRIVCIIVSIFLIISYTVPAFAELEPTFDVTSESVILINSDTETVTYEKNADKKMYPTAFNKIMTAALALENVKDIDNTITTVTESALDDENLVFNASGIEAGEIITMRDLIASVLISSANDSCNVIAEYVGGSIPKFVDMMNQKAKDIGCTSTNFTNAHGMHDEQQYTTCRDMAKIVEYALEQPGFYELCSQAKYTLAATNKNKERNIKTTNAMMMKSSEYYYGAVKGIKYGFTNEGGRCIASTASKDGYNYILILMGGPIKDAMGEKLDYNTAYSETKQLYDWAFSSFIIKEILNENSPVTDVKVKSSWDTDHIHAMPETNFIAYIPKNEEDREEISYVFNLPDYVKAPVKKGQILGSMQIMYGDTMLGEMSLVSAQSVEKSEYVYVLEVINSIVSSKWFKISAVVIVALVFAYFIFAMISNMRRKKQRKKKKNAENIVEKSEKKE